jgi:hypothetical protein
MAIGFMTEGAPDRVRRADGRRPSVRTREDPRRSVAEQAPIRGRAGSYRGWSRSPVFTEASAPSRARTGWSRGRSSSEPSEQIDGGVGESVEAR